MLLTAITTVGESCCGKGVETGSVHEDVLTVAVPDCIPQLQWSKLLTEKN